MPNTTLDLMRMRFNELREQVSTIEAASQPLRDARDVAIAELQQIEAAKRPAIVALTVQITEAEAGLYEAKVEMGQLVRALDGKTATPD